MKPRIALYYWVLPSTGMRNDGACLFMNYNFRKILNGCKTQEEVKNDMSNQEGNVRHLFPYGDTSRFGQYDLHLLIDHGEDALGVPLNYEYPHPNAYWTSDTHLGYEHRLKTAKEFDFVFCAQRQAMRDFIRDGVDPKKVFYLPHAAETDCYRPIPIVERWEWCFIGHLNSPHRIQLLDAFCKKWSVGEKGYLGWREPDSLGRNVMDDANKKYNQSKIIISDSIKVDLNMRTFETLAAKRCLLTNQIDELEGMFESGKHLLTYDSVGQAVMMADDILKDEERRKWIAEEGYKEVISKHTYHHRAEEILKVCLNYVPEKGEITTCLSV